MPSASNTRSEAKFHAPASVGLLEARHLFREWDTETAGRFENIRRTPRRGSIELDHKNAVALAGKWYSWFIKRHENEPGEPGRYWQVLLDFLVDDMRRHSAHDPDGHVVDAEEIMRDPEALRESAGVQVREKMHPVIADLGHTTQFLAGRGIALANKASIFDFTQD
jgi:hypothetical protein